MFVLSISMFVLKDRINNVIAASMQGRIGPAAPPPLRAVGPWLNHAFLFNELICCETYLNFH